MHEFHTQRKVEFVDTDMAGIVHFSRYLIFIETAEHQFLEAIGSCVRLERGDESLGWPRVSVACEYKSPARFGDELDIRLRVVRKGTRSMTYGFRISVGDREVATAEVTAICCLHGKNGAGLRSIPIPPEIADRIEEAPA